MAALLVVIHAILWTILVGNLIYLRRTSRPVPASSTGRKVSVLIPARNEAHNLKTLLPELLNQTYAQLEVVVYDDDSADDTESIVRGFEGDPRLIYVRGYGPPAGWVGKVAALHQAARRASGQLYLFLDADARPVDGESLELLVRMFESQPTDSVLTTLPELSGAGRLLVSLVPFTILSALPWFLVRPTRSRAIAALNGQAWMISAETYHRLEPHEQVKDKVLEDVEIGRYLKSCGVYSVLVRERRLLSVNMYTSFRDAWQGFRKNAYLIMGGHPVPFLIYAFVFAAATWLAPLASTYFLISAWTIKLVSDRLSGIPLTVSLLAPVSFMLATFLQIDSATSHWRGSVAWKGRNVGGN